MKNILLLITICLLNIALNAQDQKKLDAILKEGQLLYRLDKATRISSTTFLKSFTHLKSNYGGCASYETEGLHVITVIFSKRSEKIILARYQYDKALSNKTGTIDTTNNKASEEEIQLRRVKIYSSILLKKNATGFFKSHENTSRRIIPIAKGKSRIAYILTRSDKENELIFGNDYRLTFNKKWKLKTSKRYHNLARVASKTKDGKAGKFLVHLHSGNQPMTPTDICATLIHTEKNDLEKHIVAGRTTVFILDINKQTLTSMPKEQYLKKNLKKK